MTAKAMRAGTAQVRPERWGWALWAVAHSIATKPPRRAKVSARAERVPQSEPNECSTSHMIPLPMVVRSAFSLRPGPSFGGARHEGSRRRCARP